MDTRRAADARATAAHKLARMAEELRQGASFPITRLTTLKRLCAEPADAARFALHLAQLAQRSFEEAPPEHLAPERRETFGRLIAEGVDCLRRHLVEPTPETERELRAVRSALEQAQSQYKNTQWAQVRIMESRDALLVEDATNCVLRPHESAYWGYQLGRIHGERYNPRYGSGLIPESAPRVQEIADFWLKDGKAA
ncbi:MAG TPA: hypothetical protein VF746_15290 [Longimicrobium sp.]|jgi:hypothetical protein